MNNKAIHTAPVDAQSPQASASTNSATRAQMSFLDGVSQETGAPSSANDNEEKFPKRKISAASSNLTVGNQNALPKQGVYFLASKNGKRIKVGKSVDVIGRVGGIARMNAHGLVLIATIPGGYSATEKVVHRMLAEHRQHGEWFSYEGAVRALVSKVRSNVMPVEVRDAVRLDEGGADRAVHHAPNFAAVKRARPTATPRLLNSLGDILQVWVRENGPDFNNVRAVPWLEFCEANRFRVGSDPQYSGAWVKRGTLKAYRGSYVGPMDTASGLVTAHRGPRLRSLIVMACNDFNSPKVRFKPGWPFPDGFKDVYEILESPAMYISGNAKYCLPVSDERACKLHRAGTNEQCKCDSWSYDAGARDQVEELERVTHCAAAWARDWDLVSFADHVPS